MTVKSVVQIDDPKIFEPSVEVLPRDFRSPEVQTLIKDMFETMQATQGIGIAAPQIGVNRRVVIFGGKSERYADQPEIPMTRLINPIYRVLDASLEDGEEGCLTVRGVRGVVPRYKKILYGGYDVDAGKEIFREAEGFHARVVQHEIDHLEGVLFVARVRRREDLRFEKPSFEELYRGRDLLELARLRNAGLCVSPDSPSL